MSATKIYCRFCAEEKMTSELAATTSQEYLKTVAEKLLFLDNNFVDLYNKYLPETVCSTCYEFINVSVTFFLNVQKAQVVLRGIFEVENKSVLLDSFICKSIKEEYAEDQDFPESDQPVFDDTHSTYNAVVNTPQTFDVNYKLKHEKETTEFKPNLQLNVINTKLKVSINTWSDYPIRCKVCKKEAIDREQLRNHSKKLHGKCLTLSCVDCDYDVETFEEFLVHVGLHRPNLRNICPYCDTGFPPGSDHIDQHTANKYPCLICGAIYINKGTLRRHQKLLDPSPVTSPTIHQRNKKPTLVELTCPQCGVVMKTLGSLKAHLSKHGERKRDYTCDRCGKAYYSKATLDAHFLIHENLNRQACKICNKTFLTIQRLRKHIKTHNLEMPFQCDDCKRFFNSKDRLREHVKVHLNITPYHCKFCPKKFKFHSILKNHVNQHTGAKPYSCGFCSMDFSNWSNCNKHMKRKHNSTLAKNVMTPHGKLALNPKTGKPDDLYLDHGVKEWSDRVLNVVRKKKLNGNPC